MSFSSPLTQKRISGSKILVNLWFPSFLAVFRLWTLDFLTYSTPVLCLSTNFLLINRTNDRSPSNPLISKDKKRTTNHTNYHERTTVIPAKAGTNYQHSPDDLRRYTQIRNRPPKPVFRCFDVRLVTFRLCELLFTCHILMSIPKHSFFEYSWQINFFNINIKNL